MTAHLPAVGHLEQLVGVSFHDARLLRQAFIHRSVLNENPSAGLDSNERLEFLGDAFLGFVVASMLFDRDGNADEGTLTKQRAALVQRDTLAGVVERLGWGSALMMGAGEEARGGRVRRSTLANLYEAVLGAVLLDQGETVAHGFALETLHGAIAELDAGSLAVDHKSLLQERCQAQRWTNPTYRPLDEQGPPHARHYTVEVLVNSEVWGQGSGTSRRRAEKDAARDALERFALAIAETPS